jgi:hypothetical protein
MNIPHKEKLGSKVGVLDTGPWLLDSRYWMLETRLTCIHCHLTPRMKLHEIQCRLHEVFT